MYSVMGYVVEMGTWWSVRGVGGAGAGGGKGYFRIYIS